MKAYVYCKTCDDCIDKSSAKEHYPVCCELCDEDICNASCKLSICSKCDKRVEWLCLNCFEKSKKCVECFKSGTDSGYISLPEKLITWNTYYENLSFQTISETLPGCFEILNELKNFYSGISEENFLSKVLLICMNHKFFGLYRLLIFYGVEVDNYEVYIYVDDSNNQGTFSYLIKNLPDDLLIETFKVRPDIASLFAQKNWDHTLCILSRNKVLKYLIENHNLNINGNFEYGKHSLNIAYWFGEMIELHTLEEIKIVLNNLNEVSFDWNAIPSKQTIPLVKYIKNLNENVGYEEFRKNTQYVYEYLKNKTN